MKFVIFHGSYGSSNGNWFPDLKKRLELINQEVIAPRFPVENWDTITQLGEKKAKATNQTLPNWLNFFKKKVLKEIKSNKQLVFIGHSLSPVFILHAVEAFKVQLDCGIFVCPFFELPKDEWQIDLVNRGFYRKDFDFEKLKKLIPTSYVLHSDNDPYVKTNYSLDFASKMGSSVIMVKGAGHFNADNKFFSFPLVYELCKTRLDPKNYL